MTLIEDARHDLFSTEYADDYTGASWVRCRLCDALDGQHDPLCTAPRIVAALEVAQNLIGTINWDANEAWVIEAVKRWETQMDDIVVP